MARNRLIVVVLAVAATVAVAAAVLVWWQTRADDPAGAGPTGSIPTSATPTGSGGTSASGAVVVGQPGDGFVTAAPEAGAPAVDLDQFSSPTGNIGCVVSSAFAVCEIGDYEFALPPKPTDCEGDWGAEIEFTDPGAPPAMGACKTDTTLGAPDVLAYGTTTVIGAFACLSQEAGMTCWNQQTGHGFTLSRAAYALF